MDRDKEILVWIEKHKSITINQCAKIFFKESNDKNAYYQARKRLRLLYQNKYIKRFRNDMRHEAVYFLSKKLSYHDLKIFDIYAELTKLDADITNFKKEYSIKFKSKEYRVDALIEFNYNGYFYPLVVEIDYTHYTSKKKLLSIYNSQHFQKKYKESLGENDIFPTILIVRPFLPTTTNTLPFNVLYTNYTLQDINSIF